MLVQACDSLSSAIAQRGAIVTNCTLLLNSRRLLYDDDDGGKHATFAIEGEPVAWLQLTFGFLTIIGLGLI